MYIEFPIWNSFPKAESTCISQEQKLHKYSMLKWPKEGEEVKLTLTLELSVRNLSIDFVKLKRYTGHIVGFSRRSSLAKRKCKTRM